MFEIAFQIIAAIFSFSGAGGDTWVCFDETDEWNCSQIAAAPEAQGREVVYVGPDAGIQTAIDRTIGSLSAEAAPRPAVKAPSVKADPAPVAPVAQAPAAPAVEEDEENWNCFTMGNGDCGTLPFYPVAQDGTLGPCVYTADYYVMCPGGETFYGQAPEDTQWEEPVTGGPFPKPQVPLYHGTTGLVPGCLIDYNGTVTCEDGTGYEADPERYWYSVEQGA